LLIVLAAFVGLFVVRVSASERRRIMRRWPALALAGAAALALSRGAYSFALAAACMAGLAWFLWPRTVHSPQGADDAADAGARTLLGVGVGATAAEIRAAYRAKMAQAHPDRGGSHDRAARLTAARDLLLRRCP
jgi:hypothetical protein